MQVILADDQAKVRSALRLLLEAFSLGLGEPVGISAEHGEGVADLFGFAELLARVEELELAETYDFSYDLDVPVEIDPETGAGWLEDYARRGFDTFDMADHYGSAELISGRFRQQAGLLRVAAGGDGGEETITSSSTPKCS